MKSLIKKFIHREKYCAETYLEHLRKIGVTIGEGTRIYDPVNTHIDEYRPYLITIGKNCKIENAIIDKNSSIGDNCILSPANKPDKWEAEGLYVRDGVLIITKDAVIPSNTVI